MTNHSQQSRNVSPCSKNPSPWPHLTFSTLLPHHSFTPFSLYHLSSSQSFTPFFLYHVSSSQSSHRLTANPQIKQTCYYTKKRSTSGISARLTWTPTFVFDWPGARPKSGKMGSSKTCILRRDLHCPTQKGNHKGVCEIDHVTYYNNPKHRTLHAPVRISSSIEAYKGAQGDGRSVM